MTAWKFSRYWNRFAYLIIKLGASMVWDQTGKTLNTTEYSSGYNIYNKTAEEILTYTGENK